MQSSRTEMSSSLAAEIEALCIKKLSIRVSSTDQDLFESGLLDSLSLVQLIVELERHYQVELPIGEIDIAALRSIGEMAQLIGARRASPARLSPGMVNQLAS